MKTCAGLCPGRSVRVMPDIDMGAVSRPNANSSQGRILPEAGAPISRLFYRLVYRLVYRLDLVSVVG
jgi:hypothetical protein